MKFSLLLSTIGVLFFTSTASAQFELGKGPANLLDQRRAGATATITGGEVTAISVRGAGGGYTVAPSVILTAPESGSTATATATVSGGEVTGFTIVNPGSGYTSPPGVFVAPPYTASGPVTTTPQFSSAANTSAASNGVKPGDINDTPFFPSASDRSIVAAPVTTITLAHSTFGQSFSAGVPRYFMGDEIQRPNVSWDGSIVAQGQDYWRKNPVVIGESFSEVHLANLPSGTNQPLLPEGSVSVTSSATDNNSVTVASVPSTLVQGATLLGQRVNLIVGNTITLAGDANQTITGSTSVAYSSPQPYYFSPHANRVFASQPGRVKVTWVSVLPDTSAPDETVPTFKFRQETFAVSSASQKPARTIFWTEKSFNGPLVFIPTGRIVRANPVYNTFVPGATQEYVPVGSNPNSATETAAEPRTIWFDDQTGPAALHAYNIEGRVFVEYLGAEKQGTNGEHEFLGADIVDIRRVAEITTIETHLGERLRPRSETAQNGDDQLIPKILFNLAAGGTTPYGSFIRPDGMTDYYAEKENLNPDLITINWLENQDAAIHFLKTPAAPNLEIAWPKYRRNYTQVWPGAISAYEPVNVTHTGNDLMTGPRFTPENLPQLIFQDDPTSQEAEINSETQTLLVDFTASADNTNRSLLKFTSSAGPWYVRLFIQSQDQLGSPEIVDTDGNGPIEARPAVYTLNDQDADGVADWSPTSPDRMTTATVGARLEPPSPDYEPGGYIASGRLYSEAAYLNPFTHGVAAAGAGGIIPVNSLPSDNMLTVWWFKKISPPNSKLSPFYVPAVAARYQIGYPTTPQELVIASNQGIENPSLTSVQSSGSIYVQNDPALIGYNPNEEHAMMLAGNAYALRDDLNTATSSEPFVLIQYTEAATSRPAMRVAKVVRETLTYPLVYDKIAGTPAQPPLPLTALPLPLETDGKTVRNQEVATSAPDLATGSGAPAEYNSFTFADRKGQHWIYRGPHDGGAPSFGMKFYYYLRDGFHFPALDAASQPALGSIQPYIADVGSGESITLTYLPKWPDDPTLPVADQKVLGVLQTAETLALVKDGLPQVRGQSSAKVLYQQSIANNGSTKPSVALHDPTRQKTVNLDHPGVALDALPPSVLTTNYAGKVWFQLLPPNLQNRFYFDINLGNTGALVLIGEFIDVISGEDYFHLNKLSIADIDDLKALCPAADTANKSKWDGAIDTLSTTLETFHESPTVPGSYEANPALDITIANNQRSDVPSPETAVDSYALSSTGLGTGYVTLVFGNGEAFTDTGDPVVLQIIKVDPQLYKGDLKVLLASNPLDEQVIVRHSGDYGGNPENFEFEWRYGFSNGGFPPSLTNPATNPDWIAPSGTLGSSILVGGSPTAVISTPAVLLGDTYFTMRYRKAGSTLESDYSNWNTPVLVEGWIKRVLAKITPFNQRMENLYSSSLNTDVSLITQAGTRWVGDIALNLDNINDAGLIEIYETILNRGKSFSIGSGIDFAPSNEALTLAAGYLHDLYTILGNEAFADAANPTISIDDQTSVTEVNTSRFSFEGQVSSSLDEELALLRGRDDFGLPSVGIAPAYNRLFWNYTRGIDSGEVLYAVNYNIQEKAGSSTENGIVDAADAQRQYPQGHGDAYGHYLTALTGYYKLLQHPQFTWSPQAEAVNVLGQAVLIDYKDERKFAAAAANLSNTSQQVLALVHRQSYTDDPSAGWASFRDNKTNPRTSIDRHQGLDEWSSRTAQGNFFHWVTANALLPDVDTDPSHTGVQIIDRTTVPELAQLAAGANSIQSTMDLANAHLNPLGISPGAIAFDISPSEHQAGNSHYEQIYSRALSTLLNAKGSFDQAARMTRLLRNQENQISEKQEAIADQERAYVTALQEIYGTPYAGDIGPGKTYGQGYSGPDTENWFIVDRPSDFIDTTPPVTITARVPNEVKGFTGIALNDIVSSYNSVDTVKKTLTITPNRFIQFATVIDSSGGLGSRPLTGKLQQALLKSHLAQVALIEANQELQVMQQNFVRESEVVTGLIISHLRSASTLAQFKDEISSIKTSSAILTNVGNGLSAAAEAVQSIADAASEGLPRAVGLATDATSIGRAAFKFVGAGGAIGLRLAGLASTGAGAILSAKIPGLTQEMEAALSRIGFAQEELQAVYELEQLYRELLNQHFLFERLATGLQNADQEVSNLSFQGQRLLSERETYRQRAAAVINGFRTNDLTFRTFRNEALEQYRTLFDLASRYSYLAAKSYDYETGLLGTPEGTATINRLVSARSLGDLTDGIPQATTSTLGDAGLAGTMAQINADFSVAEGRLGINNPDQNGTLFSLRHELYRILDDPKRTDDDLAWQQALEQQITPDLLSDPDVARHCNNLRKHDGTPVPGILISFSTTIEHGKNFFGLDFAAGDHNYTPSSYATKISSAGIVLPGYVGMDPFAEGTPNAGGPDASNPGALGATPYLYLIPCGTDSMLAPPLGDTNTIRTWNVDDQALPLPYNLGASDFNTTQFFTANGTLSEQPWILRKHQAFRPVHDPAFFYSRVPQEFTNSRLIGRSAWNSQWKIVIPAYTLLNDEQEGLDRFVKSVKDVQLFLRTYSHSGN